MLLETQNRKKMAHFIASCGRGFRDMGGGGHKLEITDGQGAPIGSTFGRKETIIITV